MLLLDHKKCLIVYAVVATNPVLGVSAVKIGVLSEIGIASHSPSIAAVYWIFEIISAQLISAPGQEILAAVDAMTVGCHQLSQAIAGNCSDGVVAILIQPTAALPCR